MNGALVCSTERRTGSRANTDHEETDDSRGRDKEREDKVKVLWDVQVREKEEGVDRTGQKTRMNGRRKSDITGNNINTK